MEKCFVVRLHQHAELQSGSLSQVSPALSFSQHRRFERPQEDAKMPNNAFPKSQVSRLRFFENILKSMRITKTCCPRHEKETVNLFTCTVEKCQPYVLGADRQSAECQLFCKRLPEYAHVFLVDRLYCTKDPVLKCRI